MSDDSAAATDPADANPADANPAAADPADGAAPTQPSSGIDLARAALAAAQADARAKGVRRSDRTAVRRGDVSGQRRSGAHPDDRDPQPLAQAVDRLIADRGWQTQAAVSGVIARWDVVVGAEVAAHCTPETYDETILTVRADSTAWATQVRLLSPQLVRRLNDECGAGSVTKVMVLGPGRPSWRKGLLHVRGRGPRDTYG